MAIGIKLHFAPLQVAESQIKWHGSVSPQQSADSLFDELFSIAHKQT